MRWCARKQKALPPLSHLHGHRARAGVHAAHAGVDGVGHGAVVHSRRVGCHVLIGMNATTLHNSEIGNRCIIAAGSVVTEGMKIPDGSFVVGVPAKIKSPVTEKQKGWVEGHENAYPDMAAKFKSEGL